MNYHHLTEIFGKRKKFPKFTPPIRAHRDWKIIFFGFLSVLIILIAATGYIFFQISRGEIFLVSKPEDYVLGKIDKAQLQKTVDLYKSKADTLANLKKNPPTFVDPSL